MGGEGAVVLNNRRVWVYLEVEVVRAVDLAGRNDNNAAGCVEDGGPREDEPGQRQRAQSRVMARWCRSCRNAVSRVSGLGRRSVGMSVAPRQSV